MGLFADDTRFLSRWVLTINGARPLMLSSRKVEYYSAAFFLRNPVGGGLEHDEISIGRERFIGDCHAGAHRRLEPLRPGVIAFDLSLEIGTDFADIFAVKAYDFALGDPEHAAPLPQPVEPVRRGRRQPVRARLERHGFHGLTQVVLSERGETDGRRPSPTGSSSSRARPGACART